MTGCWRFIGLSSTPWRNDDTDLVMQGAVGPVVYDIPYEKLITEIDPKTGRGYLTAPLIIFEEMPAYRIDRDQGWQSVYAEYMEVCVEREQATVEFVKYMNSKGRSVAVLVGRIEHGRRMSDLLGCPFTHGQSSDDYRLLQLNDLRAKRSLCLVSTLIGEAINIPSLDGVVNALAGKSSIGFYQGMRQLTGHPGKFVGIVLDFKDHAPFLNSWSRQRRSYCGEEIGFTVAERDHFIDSPSSTNWESRWTWLDPYLTGEKDLEATVRERMKKAQEQR